MISEYMRCEGRVKIDIEDIYTGEKKTINIKNTILNSGKADLAACLANDIGTVFNFYVSSMLIGTAGVDNGGNVLVVSPERTGLFGATLLNKNIISSIDSINPRLVHFTAVIASTEGNGSELSEAALQLANGDLYSQITYPVISKTSSVQIVITWDIEML